MPVSETDRIVAFLQHIGLRVQKGTVPGETILPGILVERGGLVYDDGRLAHPGDLLHEAGHLAVLPRIEREALHGDVATGPGEEMAAIAWSWAACVHLRLDHDVLFHPDGYRGGADALIDNFRQQRYVGVPMLEWRGLTDYQRPGAAQSQTRYPLMKRWLCD